MSAKLQNMTSEDQPLRVPCPPPALRMPPKAYRSPPQTLSGISKPIPWPPSGARFPGDRIFWPPMRFPEPSITNEISDLMDRKASVSEMDPDSTIGSESVFSALELADDFSDSAHERESIPYITEDLPPAKHPMGVILEVDWHPDIDDSHQDPIIENAQLAEQALELHPNVASDDLIPRDEQPTNRIESMPITEALRRELQLSGDAIQITELADLIGIRGYEVLRDLVQLEHFAKTNDTVSAEIAVKVGLKHGVNFILIDSVAEDDVRRNSFSSPPPASANHDDIAFQIDIGQHVRAGDWIRDSRLGLGRILKLHTDPLEPDSHQVWFVGNTEEGKVVERHAIHSSTLGIIDPSMIPDDIRSAAPEIC
jgi:hypothetical protein